MKTLQSLQKKNSEHVKKVLRRKYKNMTVKKCLESELIHAS